MYRDPHLIIIMTLLGQFLLHEDLILSSYKNINCELIFYITQYSVVTNLKQSQTNNVCSTQETFSQDFFKTLYKVEIIARDVSFLYQFSQHEDMNYDYHVF